MRALLVPALVLALTACAEAVAPEGTTGADAGTGDVSTDAGDAGTGGSTDAAGDGGGGGGALDGGADAVPHDDTGADASADASADATTDATADTTTDAGSDSDASEDARTDAGDILAALRSDTNTLIDELIATHYARAQISCDCRGDEVGTCMDHFAVSFDPAMACTREVASSLDLETLRIVYGAMACELTELQTRLACEEDAACDPDVTAACTMPSPCDDTPEDVDMAIRACVAER